MLNKDFCDGQIYKDMFEVLETQNRAFVEKKNGTQATGYETWTVAMINKKAKDYAYSTCKRIQ